MKQYIIKTKNLINKIEESIHESISPRYAAIKENIERDWHDAIIEDIVRKYGRIELCPNEERQKLLGIKSKRDDTGAMGACPPYCSEG